MVKGLKKFLMIYFFTGFIYAAIVFISGGLQALVSLGSGTGGVLFLFAYILLLWPFIIFWKSPQGLFPTDFIAVGLFFLGILLSLFYRKNK